MTHESKPGNSLGEDLQFSTALAQMSETEQACLLNMAETFEEGFCLIPLRNGEAVAVAQNFLNIWNSEVDRILVDKQASDTSEQLNNWDNEGGTVDPAPSRRIVVRTESGKRRLVWADVEETH